MQHISPFETIENKKKCCLDLVCNIFPLLKYRKLVLYQFNTELNELETIFETSSEKVWNRLEPSFETSYRQVLKLVLKPVKNDFFKPIINALDIGYANFDSSLKLLNQQI